jgi:DNA (cytosine-5)-methyltransferase 1
VSVRKLQVLDLFSGIGGFSLGLERAGMETAAFCEISPYPRAVLQRHWPKVKLYDDIRQLSAERLRDDGLHIDVICGGFPCQDISFAGNGAGLEGERSGLWFEMLRLIGEVRPSYVIVENVAALRNRGLDTCLGGLAAIGYDAEWHCIPASAVGAPHRRDRVWVIAHLGDANQVEGLPDEDGISIMRSALAGACGVRTWADEPGMGGVAYGIPNGPHRVAACGNAVVPQIPELLGRAILAHRNAA